VTAIGGARGDRIQTLERRHQLAGGEQLDDEAAARHVVDTLGEALGVDADAGRVARPRHHHVPLGDALADRRCGEAGHGGGGGAGGKNVAALHRLPPSNSPAPLSAGGEASPEAKIIRTLRLARRCRALCRKPEPRTTSSAVEQRRPASTSRLEKQGLQQ
jgi:hypothetical protein